jgi:hypothetical protein
MYRNFILKGGRTALERAILEHREDIAIFLVHNGGGTSDEVDPVSAIPIFHFVCFGGRCFGGPVCVLCARYDADAGVTHRMATRCFCWRLRIARGALRKPLLVRGCR